jgi:DNA-binding transcriptional LysR family regulator
VRLAVNEALTIHRLVRCGAGVGCLSAYICAPDIQAGRLVRLLPEWKLPSLEVSAVFPSNRELAPAVRAFVDFMSSASGPGSSWRSDPLLTKRATPERRRPKRPA